MEEAKRNLRKQGGRGKERGRFHSILAKALIRNDAFQPVDNFFLLRSGGAEVSIIPFEDLFLL